MQDRGQTIAKIILKRKNKVGGICISKLILSYSNQGGVVFSTGRGSDS